MCWRETDKFWRISHEVTLYLTSGRFMILLLSFLWFTGFFSRKILHLVLGKFYILYFVMVILNSTTPITHSYHCADVVLEIYLFFSLQNVCNLKSFPKKNGRRIGVIFFRELFFHKSTLLLPGRNPQRELQQTSLGVNQFKSGYIRLGQFA